MGIRRASDLDIRNSHGLDQFCSALGERPGMLILDLAGVNQPTVSFLTNYGHRLYSDDFLRQLDQAFGTGDTFEDQGNPLLVSQFIDSVLPFSESHFDGALVWDTLQFLAPSLLEQVVAKLLTVLRPGASLLAFFHAEERVDMIPAYSYRIHDHKSVELVDRGRRRPVQLFNNRTLEKLFRDFHSVKFFLTRDHLREVIVKR